MAKATAALEILGQRFLDKKADEIKAIGDRREIGEQMQALPEVEAEKKPKGSVTFKGAKLDIEFKFVENETFNVEEFGKGLPPEAMKRIFPPKPVFSQSAYNLYLKELEGEGVHSPVAAKLRKKIIAAYEDNRSSKPGATQISVKPKEIE